MHARSAVFDLYGDHFAERGGEAPVATIVRLLEPVGVAAPAVRTAISRMVSQGWLEPVALPQGRGYRATDQARTRLAEAGQRIYGRTRPWDGSWHTVLVDLPAGRSARARVRADLGFLGFAALTSGAWVSPHPSPEVSDVLARAGLVAAAGRLSDVTPPEAPMAAWDVDALRAAYEAWLETTPSRVAEDLAAHPDPDTADFAARFRLVHEWRKFLFTDPGLPVELLPPDWPGGTAAQLFGQEAARLRPGADRFVERCLGA